MKQFTQIILIAVLSAVSIIGCDQKNNRNATTRAPFYGQGYNYNQPFYQNCGQPTAQYTNPYNNQQIYCQYQNGQPQFMNNQYQPFMNDMYGNPCLSGTIDPYTGYCQQYYYPMWQ